MITAGVILTCMDKSEGTLIQKEVEIPGERYTAYTINQPGGQELKLIIKKDDDKVKRIIETTLKDRDEGDDTVQWYRISESGSKHIHRTCIVNTTNAGSVLSSREWVWIEGKYEPVAEDYSGEGETEDKKPKFNVRVPAVDIDILESGGFLTEEAEETEGAYLCVGGGRKKMMIREVKQVQYGTQKLEWNSAKVSIWTEQTGGSKLTGNSKDDLSAGSDHEYWVQADSPSSGLRDVELKVSYEVSNETAVDKVRVTAVEVKFDALKAIVVGEDGVFFSPCTVDDYLLYHVEAQGRVKGDVVVMPDSSADLVALRLLQNINTVRIFQNLEDDLSYQRYQITTDGDYYFDGVMEIGGYEHLGNGEVQVWGDDNPDLYTVADGPTIINAPHEHPLDIDAEFRTYMQYNIPECETGWKTIGTVDWGWIADIYRSTNSIITTSGEVTEGIGVASEADPVTAPDIHDVDEEPID
jgi:hypothetical protein